MTKSPRVVVLTTLLSITAFSGMTCAAKPDPQVGGDRRVQSGTGEPRESGIDSVLKEYDWKTERYEVMLRTREQSNPWDRQGVHGLDIDTVPGVVVETMRFRPVGGAEWFACPFSAHGDLAQIRSVSAEVEGSMIKVLIKGSDAGSSYTATLVFVDGYLRTREVRSGEFPDHHYERTEYHSFNPFEE